MVLCIPYMYRGGLRGLYACGIVTVLLYVHTAFTVYSMYVPILYVHMYIHVCTLILICSGIHT